MTLFQNLLIGQENDSSKDISLFGQLIGEWDFDWVGHGSNEEKEIKGEWIFSSILNGNAIQDMFICPSRQERENGNPEKGGIWDYHSSSSIR